MAPLPLDGVRVVDSTYVVAMPYACSILADLGADVIKVEGPSHVDGSRAISRPTGPDNVPGDDFWNRALGFNMLNHGKRSLTLDLTGEEGRELFRRLVQVSDIVLENFTPRVMRRWNLDYPNLKKIKPDIIMLSNTGYGHSEGPYTNYPGQATTLEGTHGTVSVTGFPGDVPSKAGRSYVDYLACWSALFSVATALRYRNRTGKGQWIDLGMYQLGCMFIGEYIMDWVANGRNPARIGNRHPWRAPQGIYPCAGDDQWCAISVGDDDEWEALSLAMGRPDLAQDTRYAGHLGRRRNHDELDEVISAWTRGLDKYELMELLQGVGVPAGPVFDYKDSSLDPHTWASGFKERVTAPTERGMGTRVFIARPWRLSKSKPHVKGFGPALGAANRSILSGLLDVGEDRIAELEAQDVIASMPTLVREGNATTGRESSGPGLGDTWYDPDYKKNLGI